MPGTASVPTNTALVGVLTGTGDKACCASGDLKAAFAGAIADEHATFGVTCRRWNIRLADGGTQRRTRILGYRRAMRAEGNPTPTARRPMTS